MNGESCALWAHCNITTSEWKPNSLVFECAIKVTDNKLRVMSEYSAKILDDEHIDLVRLKLPEKVDEMFDDNGLWGEIGVFGQPSSLVDEMMTDHLKSLELKCPLVVMGFRVKPTRDAFKSVFPITNQMLEPGFVDLDGLIGGLSFFAGRDTLPVPLYGPGQRAGAIVDSSIQVARRYRAMLAGGSRKRKQ